MAEETSKEKYERLQREIRSEILTAYPNPTRKGCPGGAIVKQVAERKKIETDAAWEHITHCSPCYKEFLAHRETVRVAKKRRRNSFRYQVLAAACLVVAAVVFPLIRNRTNLDRRYSAEFDLRHTLSFRGASPSGQEATQLDPPLILHRGRVHLKIDLPETWRPGKYDVAFLDQSDEQRLFSATANTEMQGSSLILNVDIQVDVNPGDYMISLRREGSRWRGHPVRVTNGQP
jgi:hypothetical protein